MAEFLDKWFPRAMVALAAAITIGGIAYAQFATSPIYHSASSQHVCVLNSAGGTAVPTTPLASRAKIAIQNQATNPIYCTADGDAPLTNGTSGFNVAGGTTWSENLAPSVGVKCITAGNSQTAGQCCAVTEYRATPTP